MNEKRTMDCPGCGATVPRTLVACADCWRRVPAGIASGIYRTLPGTMGRLRAIIKARAWLRENSK